MVINNLNTKVCSDIMKIKELKYLQLYLIERQTNIKSSSKCEEGSSNLEPFMCFSNSFAILLLTPIMPIFTEESKDSLVEKKQGSSCTNMDAVSEMEISVHNI